MHFILIVIILLIVIVDYMMKYFLLKVEKGITFLEMIILEKIYNILKKYFKYYMKLFIFKN